MLTFFKTDLLFLPDIQDFQNMVYYQILCRKSKCYKTFKGGIPLMELREISMLE